MLDESIHLIQWESENSEGILVSFRMARPVARERFVALRAALGEIANAAKDWQSLDRDLAAALHTLSFHLEGNASALREKGKLVPEIDEELPLIYELIDDIFGS